MLNLLVLGVMLSLLAGGLWFPILATVRYRSGGYRLRNGRWVNRTEHPGRFWVSVAIPACFGVVFAGAEVFLFGLFAGWWTIA